MKLCKRFISPNIIIDCFYKSIKDSVIYFNDNDNKTCSESAVINEFTNNPVAENKSGFLSGFNPFLSLGVSSFDSHSQSEKTGDNKKSATTEWSDKKILIVEDDDTNFLFFQHALKKTNVKIIRALDGMQAIKLCRENNDIDLILMDIQLPLMDGYDATIEIRAFRKYLPIIAQTAYAQTTDKDKCFICGCNEFITKPIDRLKLIEIINNYFNK
jgi:two-component system, cell cycle response regulator DivK